MTLQQKIASHRRALYWRDILKRVRLRVFVYEDADLLAKYERVCRKLETRIKRLKPDFNAIQKPSLANR